jgi:putative acetyltransferase
MPPRIAPALTPDDLETIRELMREYQAQLGVDLSFQGFDDELAALPGAYAPPSGRLLLARQGGTALGCIALRDAGDGRAEMKRLYVRPQARGLGLGRALAERIVEEARSAGYAAVVLDTLPSMGEAHRLYEQLGFRPIAPYNANPIAGTRHLGLPLRAG